MRRKIVCHAGEDNSFQKLLSETISKGIVSLFKDGWAEPDYAWTIYKAFEFIQVEHVKEYINLI